MLIDDTEICAAEVPDEGDNDGISTIHAMTAETNVIHLMMMKCAL